MEVNQKTLKPIRCRKLEEMQRKWLDRFSNIRILLEIEKQKQETRKKKKKDQQQTQQRNKQNPQTKPDQKLLFNTDQVLKF